MVTFFNKLSGEHQPVLTSRFITAPMVTKSPYLVYEIRAISPLGEKQYYIGYTGTTIHKRMSEHFRARDRHIYPILNEYAMSIEVVILAVANSKEDAVGIEEQQIVHAAKKYHRRNLINKIHACRVVKL